jgi:hypothetical protein
MVKHWRYSEPDERVNIDRYMVLCGTCHHYKQCVSTKIYCPPYSLAVRWNCPEHEKIGIQCEISEAKDAGWSIEDFCVICNFRCKVKKLEMIFEMIYPAPTLRYKICNQIEVCEAFRFVMDHVPCPVRK